MSFADDSIESYLKTFERLRARKRWSVNSVTFRFVALSLGAAASSISFARLEEVATELRKRARWTSPLKSEVRYVAAAMIPQPARRRGLLVAQRASRAPARSSTACSRTLAPAVQSSRLAFSRSLWLIPPSHGMKIMAVGTRAARWQAS